MRQRLPWCIAALLCAATLAQAQEPTTRAESLQEIREARAEATPVHTPGRIERFLNAIERRSLFNNLFAPADGFGIRVGGIEDGGFALGPAWRTSALAGGHVTAFASAVVSVRLDREVEAGVQLPHLAGDRLALTVRGASTHLAQQFVYGATLAERTAFAVSRETAGADLVLFPGSTLELAGGAALLSTGVADNELLIAASPASEFLQTHVAATVDYRDQRGNPRTGGRYHVKVSRFSDRGATRHSFSRVDGEFEQNISAWKKQRLVTVRAIASLSDADAGHDVPVYLQPTLGGSHLLRGFVRDRFRDRNLLVLQGEYGWDLWPFVNAVVFYEAGMVAPTARELRLTDMRRDYGIGIRLGSTRSVALRTDVAFGSGEGTRITMRFSHAF